MQRVPPAGERGETIGVERGGVYWRGERRRVFLRSSGDSRESGARVCEDEEVERDMDWGGVRWRSDDGNACWVSVGRGKTTI